VSAERILDQVCDMIVDIAEARATGLTLEHSGREHAFCALGCKIKFGKDPDRYVEKVTAYLASHRDEPAHAHGGEAPEIDDGMRRWYRSCRCCLSDAYPVVVEALDAERERAKMPKADAGICETEEAKTS